MYAEKEQWFLFIFVWVITIVSVNVWAAKRDAKLFRELERLEQQEQIKVPAIYKQLPVIPFTNEQWNKQSLQKKSLSKAHLW